MKLLNAILAVSLLAACQSVDATATRDTAADAEAPTNLEELVRHYQAQTGTNLTYNSRTAELLSAISVSPVGPPDVNVLLIGPAPGAKSGESAAFEVIPLQYAFAGDLAQVLTRLLSDAGRPASDQAIKILTDERTNSLLVSAPSARLVEMKDLIARLDVEQTSGG